MPIEALAQEALGLAGAPAIKEAGIDTFNEQCRSMVSTYVSEWEKTVTRMGRWVDFENDYKTMDRPFMESIWWVFSQRWGAGSDLSSTSNHAIQLETQHAVVEF